MTTPQPDLFRRMKAEAVGAFAIVFFGCGSIMVAERFPHVISVFTIDAVFGLVVAAMIYALGHISGAHFNPAVTLAFAITRHFPARDVLTYWAAQCSGAILAILLLKLTLPEGASYGATLPHIPLMPALIWEIILTFFLMFTVMGVATDTRAVGTMAGAAIGGVIMLEAAVGGPLTGASMNPARSLAPAIFEGRMDVLWVYTLGPIIGAILGALSYKWLRGEHSKLVG